MTARHDESRLKSSKVKSSNPQILASSKKSPLKQPSDEKDDARPDDGGEDGAERAPPERHFEHAAQQPRPHETADDTNDNVAQEAETAAPKEQPGKPTCDGADDDDVKPTFHKILF